MQNGSKHGGGGGPQVFVSAALLFSWIVFVCTCRGQEGEGKQKIYVLL